MINFAKDFELKQKTRDYTDFDTKFTKTINFTNETIISLQMPFYTQSVKIEFKNNYCLHLFFYTSLDPRLRMDYFPLHGMYHIRSSDSSLENIRTFFKTYTPAVKTGSKEFKFTDTDLPNKEFYLRIFCPFSSIGNDNRTTLVVEIDVFKPAPETNNSPVEEFQKEKPGDTLNALYSSSLFGTSIIETSPSLPEPATSGEENKTVSVALFEDANQTVSMVNFEVKRTSLDLKANRNVTYSIISKFVTSAGTQVTDYLEKNQIAKELNRQIIAQEYNQKITLIIYRPESNTVARLLQSENQVLLEMTYENATSPGTGDGGNSGGDNGSTGENGTGTGTTDNTGGTGTTDNTGGTGTTDNTGGTGTTGDNGSSNNGGSQSGGACTGDNCGDSGSSRSSFDYATLGIVLGAIAFLILVASIIAALINQKRKNRILKQKIKRTVSLNQSEGSQAELINPYKSSKIRFKRKTTAKIPPK